MTALAILIVGGLCAIGAAAILGSFIIDMMDDDDDAHD